MFRRIVFSDTCQRMHLCFGEFNVISEFPWWEGPYTITPMITEQNFLTRHLGMRENLKVKEIPYSEVSNLSGGFTATIGG